MFDNCDFNCLECKDRLCPLKRFTYNDLLYLDKHKEILVNALFNKDFKGSKGSYYSLKRDRLLFLQKLRYAVKHKKSFPFD